jgi:hypothetical protein
MSAADRYIDPYPEQKHLTMELFVSWKDPLLSAVRRESG